MRKLIFCTLLLLFWMGFTGKSNAQTVTVHQIWNDAGNLDGTRPDILPVTVSAGGETRTVAGEESVLLPDGDVNFSHEYLPSGYEIERQHVYDGEAVFVYKHVPGVLVNVSNTIREKNTDLELSVEVDYPWEGDTFRFHISFTTGSSYTYETSTGRTGTTADPMDLSPDELIVIRDLPIGAGYSITQESDRRYSTTGVIVKGTYASRSELRSFASAATDPKGNMNSNVGITGMALVASIGAVPLMTESGGVTVSGILEPYTDDDIPNQIHFANRMEFVSFAITKIWDGSYGGEIRLSLLADGEYVDDTYERPVGIEPYRFIRDADDPYNTHAEVYRISRLPKYDRQKNEVLYSAREQYMENFVTMYVNRKPYADRTKSVYSGGTIINREVVSIYIRKVWEDEKKEHPEISFKLFQNGKEIEWQSPEKLGNTYRFKNLPKYKDGHIAVYSVIENDVPGYTAHYEDEKDRAYNGGVIHNVPLPPTGDRSIPLWLYMCAAFIAICGIVWLMKKR